jgi:hypothetical protein
MKQSFKKSVLFLFVAFCTINAAFAQLTESPITAADLLGGVSGAPSSSSSSEAAILTAHFTKNGYKAAGLNGANSSKFSGTDAQGAFVIKIITQSFKKGASTVDITEVTASHGSKVEKTAFAEDNDRTYNVSNNIVRAGAVSASSSASGSPAVSGSLSSCVAQYIGSTVGDCATCIKAVTSCISGRSRWSARLICSVKCIAPCLKCMPSVSRIVSFVRCVI